MTFVTLQQLEIFLCEKVIFLFEKNQYNSFFKLNFI
jgi:hypothetical protein